MHYCCLVITKEFPSDEVLAKALAPFNEEAYYSEDESEMKPRPVFMWDWWQVGGRFAGKVKLRYSMDDNDRYNWQYYEETPRTGRLFRSFLLEKIFELRAALPQNTSIIRHMICEEDYFSSIGRNDGYLILDGAAIEDILNWEDITDAYFCLIDKDGNGYAREEWDEDNTRWVENADFDEQVRAICDRSANEGCYACFVDMHD